MSVRSTAGRCAIHPPRTIGRVSSDENRLEINWVNSAGASLAAVSSAVVLSTLGTAGTLIGAALGSLVITVGGAIYAHSLRAARARIAAGRTTLVRSKGGAAAGGPEEREKHEKHEEREEREELSRTDRWQQTLRDLPWKRILVASAAVFAVAMAAILAFELATGRPVSSYTGGSSDTGGGTSVPGIGGGDDVSGEAPGDEEAPEGVPQDQPDVDQQESVPPPEEQGPAPVEEETVEPSPVEPPAPEEIAP
jgi:hypothetical protein